MFFNGLSRGQTYSRVILIEFLNNINKVLHTFVLEMQLLSAISMFNFKIIFKGKLYKSVLAGFTFMFLCKF